MQHRRRALLRAARRVPGGAVPFIGTAMVVLRVGPFTLLTDPNFLHKGEPAHLGYGIHCG